MMTVALVVSIVVYVVGAALDYHSTVKGLEVGARERNTITVWFMERFGWRRGLLVKTIVVDLCMVGGWCAVCVILEMVPLALVLLFVGGGAQAWVARNNYRIAKNLEPRGRGPRYN